MTLTFRQSRRETRRRLQPYRATEPLHAHCPICGAPDESYRRNDVGLVCRDCVRLDEVRLANIR